MASSIMNEATNKDVTPKITNIFDQMELAHDNFDVLDDDYNDEENDDIEKQHARIHQDFSTDFNFDNTDNMMETEEEVDEDIQDNADDEGDDNKNNNSEVMILTEYPIPSSSKFNGLLTIDTDAEITPSMDGKRRRLSITSTEIINKKSRTKMEDTNGLDEMPDYLLSKNKLFDRMIQTSIDTASSINIEDLRWIAFFIHYKNYYEILFDLWSVYLQSGRGILRGEEELSPSIKNHRRYWPKQVKLLKAEHKDSLPPVITEEDEQIACEIFTFRSSHEYHVKAQYYQKQFDEKKKHLNGFTKALEEKIELFVQQHGIRPCRMNTNYDIALVHYDYDDQLLQYEYQQENPTEYQKDIAKKLYDANVQLENVKRDLLEFRQRIRYNRPPPSLDNLQISFPSYMNTLLNRTICEQLIDRHETLIQQTKTELMTVYLAAAEARIEQYQTIVNQETEDRRKNDQRQVAGKQMTKALIRLLTKRIGNMKDKSKMKCLFLTNYYIRSPYGHLENVKKGKESNIQRMGFSSRFIIDSTIATTAPPPLTNQQLRLLNRGPCYVSPCQLHRSSSIQYMNTMTKKKYAPLLRQMGCLFSKFRTDFNILDRIVSKTKKEFKNRFATPISSNLCERLSYETKVIQSIQHTLKKKNLILRRTADQNNVFYLGNRQVFEATANDYMQKADNFTILYTIDQTNERQVRGDIEKKFRLMNSKLDLLHKHDRFDKQVCTKLQINLEEMQLPYLYFLPDVTTEKNIAVKPMISTHYSATTKLAKYLNRLVRPVMTRHMGRTTFVNEADFIQKLHYYTYKEHSLKPSTLFATIKVTNFHTTVPHKSMVTTLEEFLKEHLGTPRVEYRLITAEPTAKPDSISIATFRQLTELYFENNIFYYNDNIYQFIKGGPTSLAFSETLANIYLFMWAKDIFANPALKNELYGRNKDQLFMTWNGTADDLRTFLNPILEKHQNIHLNLSISECANFLSAYIENCNGQLYTHVYRPSNIQKYTIPYISGDARFSHSHWFRSALMRAVRICSNFNDFEQERIHLEMSCLLHGYSVDFIETQLTHFYQYFNADRIRFCMNQLVYDKLRRRLFDFIDKQRKNLDELDDLENVERVIRLPYLYDYGLRQKFNEKFREIWKENLSNDAHLSNEKTKFIFKVKHIYSLNALLAQQKPTSELMRLAKS